MTQEPNKFHCLSRRTTIQKHLCLSTYSSFPSNGVALPLCTLDKQQGSHFAWYNRITNSKSHSFVARVTSSNPMLLLRSLIAEG